MFEIATLRVGFIETRGPAHCDAPDGLVSRCVPVRDVDMEFDLMDPLTAGTGDLTGSLNAGTEDGGCARAVSTARREICHSPNAPITPIQESKASAPTRRLFCVCEPRRFKIRRSPATNRAPGGCCFLVELRRTR